MQAKSTIYFYVAFLPSIIYGYKSLTMCSDDVVQIARKGGMIEGIFQPQDDKPVSISETSFVFRDNEDVEQYGIPAVYYHGTWIDNNLTMIGMSLLDKTVQEMQHTENIFEHDVNALIIIRNFIFTSKYMHSRGVRHNDITLSNIMVRGHQTFIIDFNLGSKIHEKSTCGTLDFASKRAYMGGERWPKDDWESFLYSICYSLGVRFGWMEFASSEIHIITALKANTQATKKLIDKTLSETLGDVFFEFAYDTFFEGDFSEFDDVSEKVVPGDKRFPTYVEIYKFVDNEIAELKWPTPIMFTWLTESQRKAAIDYTTVHKIPNIANIAEPKRVNFDEFYSDFDDSMRTTAPPSSSSARNPIFSDKPEKKGKAKMGDRLAYRSWRQKSE